MTRVAVIGHVEWVEFVRLADYPPRGGLEQATRVAEPAGGGAGGAAAALGSRRGGEWEFSGARGDDERARRSERELTARETAVHAARRSQPSRFVFTMLDD